jgi:dihydrodipicolinate synthase/N-acetylneuraminate lyase
MKVVGFPVGTVRKPQTQLDAKQKEAVRMLIEKVSQK